MSAISVAAFTYIKAVSPVCCACILPVHKKQKKPLSIKSLFIPNKNYNSITGKEITASKINH
jgi:hypothetical protein